MLTSVRWLNRYLEPGNLTAEEAESVLTFAGFPIESRESLGGGDTRLDVELTSNRGDCLCHVGMAREIAAATGRRLVLPRFALPRSGGERATQLASVENRESAVCPRFTARVVRGVKVGPSPRWLSEALESVGQRSINNVVDASNFVLLELGHPSHAFDLGKLEGRKLVIRYATSGEELVALDSRRHKLTPTDLVVADAKRPVSLAGIIGGLETGVTEATRDLLLEVATWDPVTIRRTARRLDIRTDASHRFERYVDARDIDGAADRLASLILEVAGGSLAEGVIESPAFAPRPRTTIDLRMARCEQILGIPVPAARMAALLSAIGVDVTQAGGAKDGGVLRCAVPHHRPDLTREIDLIEEIGRLHGFDHIKVAGSMQVPLEIDHPAEWAKREGGMREMGTVLAGQGFFETITFSFLSQEDAELFLPRGLSLLKVDEARRPGGPYLRPSILPSLLSCRRANQDAQARTSSTAGGASAGRSAGAGPRVKLFEAAAVFADRPGGVRETLEERKLALLMDVCGSGSEAERAQEGVRSLRGAIESVAHALGGPTTEVRLERGESPFTTEVLDGATSARVLINGRPSGYLGVISRAVQQRWGLEIPTVVAEIKLDEIIRLYPPIAKVSPMPSFPAIERDLSIVVEERTAWEAFEHVLAGAQLAHFEGHEFIEVYRGKQIGAGRKSVTFRLRFRDNTKTLRHEDVEPQVASVVSLCREKLGGELRA